MTIVSAIPIANTERIGFLSDTHFMAPDGSDVPEYLIDALRDVDLIVHLGHISTPAALDRLESAAPVIAVQTDLDNNIFGERIKVELERGRMAGYLPVLQAGDLYIGAVHDFSIRGVDVPLEAEGHLAFPERPMEEITASKFGRPVDLVACAATHIDMVVYRQGVLLVNPGSPNLPGGRRKGGLGTIAVFHFEGSAVRVEVRDLASHTRT